MNCQQSQKLLPAYLDNEINPSERRLLQAHLAGCKACQRDLARLSRTRELVGQSLINRAAQAAPSPQALSRLQAGLADEARSPRLRLSAGFRRSAPFAFLARSIQLFSGGAAINRRVILAVGTVVVVFAAAAVVMFNNVTPASAKEILDRASQSRAQEQPTKGILHIRLERFFNYQGLPVDQVAGTIQDTYYDLGSCNVRTTTTNSKTGVVMDVHAEDGTNVYGGFTYDINASGSLTIYRSPKDPSAPGECIKPSMDGDKDMFDQLRSQPNVELVGKQTWIDGRSVYVLHAHMPVKMIPKDNSSQPPLGDMTAYFDAKTYQFLEAEQTITDDQGQTLLINKFLYSAYEVLPAGTPVKWDVSDVQGITIIDDPDGSHRDSGARG